MYNSLPAPLACGICGALAGLIGGGFNQCLPVWIGAATGASAGCVICVCLCLFDTPEHPVAKIVRPVQTIVQNIYIIEPTGAPKTGVPKTGVPNTIPANTIPANTIPANTESDVPSK